MKIYISGPITGRVIEDSTEEFARAEEAIRAAGHEPVNPRKNGLDPKAEWIDHMEADLWLLQDCDAIVMLPGWDSSNGCRIEVSVAVLLRLLVAPEIEGINHPPEGVVKQNEMTEKEKALELIGKYQKHAMLKDFGGMDFEIARGCAMIGLDEMLDHIEVPSHICQWFKQVRIELERVEQPCT